MPIEDIIEEEKSSRKSPPESEKEKTRDVSLSMAPLPIPLGPLGGFAGKPDAFRALFSWFAKFGCKVPLEKSPSFVSNSNPQNLTYKYS